MLLVLYSASYPQLSSSKIGTKKYYSVVFGTINYPFLNELYDMFMINGHKCVPLDIFNELTPVALAHWIMCDGASAHGGLIICTDSFTIKDVVLLMNVLLIKYDIKSNIDYAQNLPRIYIGRRDVSKLKPIILNDVIPFYQYKLMYEKKKKK